MSVLDPMVAPPAPRTLAADGRALPQPRSLDLKGGPHGVLLLHGLSSGPQELQFLARGLQRAGHTVRVPVMPGYSYGAGRPDRQDAWVRAALAEFDALSARCSTVAVGGLCIGAVLALQVAALRDGRCSAVLALSTTLHYDGWATPWTRRLLWLAAWCPWAGGIAVRETAPFGVKDERMRGFIAQQMREAGNSDAGAAVLTVRDLLQARHLIEGVRSQLPAIHTPVLLLHARDDDAASLRSAVEVTQRVGARDVRCVVLTDSYHMVSIDREKHRVLDELRAFLQKQVGGHGGESALLAENPARIDRDCASRRTL